MSLHLTRGRRAVLTAIAAASLLTTAAVPALVGATAHAATTAVVVDGNARFTVLTPTLIRMEYAADGVFQDAVTFNAVNRSFAVPAYTTSVVGGVRQIVTSGVTLKWTEGSGPFTPANTSLTIAGGVTASPAFPSYCPISTVCEAENGLLQWSASTQYDHAGYTGSGFLAGFDQTNTSLTQDVANVPTAGTYALRVRYANSTGGDGQATTRTLSTTVNGAAGPTLSMPTTANWDTWSTVSVNVTLRAGINTIGIKEAAGNSGRVNLDSFAVTPTANGYPAAQTTLLTTAYGAGPKNVLGGWRRSLDNDNGASVSEHPGILDRDGWYLLDDTRTALLNPDGTITHRPGHGTGGTGAYEDGYLFAYGANYKQGLSDLNALTGATNLLPQSAYGVWYSRYFAYSASDYQNTLLPKFRSTHTPIDWLVIDTDFKSPSTWNGWGWNTSLFPDPQGFLNWTKTQGLQTSLNIHATIADNDPKYATANTTAGGLALDTYNTNFGSNVHLFDWSNPNQLKAYLDLHQPFEAQGVREWWLDYCTNCGNSTATDTSVAPDNFINQAYARDGAARGLRGFSFGRIGSSAQAANTGSYALGPWSERRNTLQFTGDTPATWDMLTLEAAFASDEAAAGVSNVSHDIGSFHGGHLADDMYLRWLQLGTFQPVLRLHSDHGDRLPWNYGTSVEQTAEKFLRLRDALVPYTYTLAQQANATGVPIIRPLYLNYPANAESYTYTHEYLYGDNVLVAPITSANSAGGTGSVSAWVPPGTWTDYFSGQTFTGPSVQTFTKPLGEMPVLIKSGGIMPTRTDYTDNAAQSPLTQVTVNVAAGADGAFSLYQDAGEGTGFTTGQSTSSPLSWSNGSRALTIGATTGTFPGAPTARSYTLRLSNATAPTAVSVDGVQVPETAWSYNTNLRTVTVTTASLSTSSSHSVSLTGAGTGNPTAGEALGVGGLCLDVRGGVNADGTAMQVYTCNHTAAQTVDYNGTAVRILGKCLDLANTSGANGTQAVLRTCNGAATQTWSLRVNGALVNPASSRCLDVPNGNTTPGAVQLQIWDCFGNAAQTWQLPPEPLVGVASLCVDVAGADPASGTAVQLYTCNNSDAQRWSAPGDGSVRTFGKCLDVDNGATANGTPVHLFDCNGSGAQKWASQANGTLVNPQSGRCLDDPNSNTTPGAARLQIWDCVAGVTGQQYRLGG